MSNTQSQSKAVVNVSSSGPSGNDLATMYGKSHTALGKVNVIWFFLLCDRCIKKPDESNNFVRHGAACQC